MHAPTWTGLSTLALGIALMGFTPAGFAQTPGEDHDAHHPPAAAEVPAAPMQPGSMGMMQQDRPPGVMGRDTEEMMSMMRTMMSMMSAQTGMMGSNVEGRIASLKVELKITDAQTPQWNRFADALRAAAQSMDGMHQQMMQSGTETALPARLDRQEAMLTAHLTSVKALKEALGPVYASFNDEQKKTADGMMICPMGMM